MPEPLKFFRMFQNTISWLWESWPFLDILIEGDSEESGSDLEYVEVKKLATAEGFSMVRLKNIRKEFQNLYSEPDILHRYCASRHCGILLLPLRSLTMSTSRPLLSHACVQNHFQVHLSSCIWIFEWMRWPINWYSSVTITRTVRESDWKEETASVLFTNARFPLFHSQTSSIYTGRAGKRFSSAP